MLRGRRGTLKNGKNDMKNKQNNGNLEAKDVQTDVWGLVPVWVSLSGLEARFLGLVVMPGYAPAGKNVA